METMILSSCSANDCNYLASSCCKRCRSVFYCSVECQKNSWSNHKTICNWIGKLDSEYKFQIPSFEHDVEWSAYQIQATEVLLQPPAHMTRINKFWKDRMFLVDNEIVVSTSVYTPEFKTLILEGIVKNVVTWDYLASDNFMDMAAHPMVPLGPLLKLLREVIFPSSMKLNASALLEIVTEEFWRGLALTSQPGYIAAAAKMLHKHNIRLPFARDNTSASEIDDLRVYSHATIEDCGCYHCLSKNYIEDKLEELWNKFVKICVTHKSISSSSFISSSLMSWATLCAYQQTVFDAYLWTIDTTPSGQVQRWAFSPDDWAGNEAYIKHYEVASLCTLLLEVDADCRYPFDEEIDQFASLAVVTRLPLSMRPRIPRDPDPIKDVSKNKQSAVTVFTKKTPASPGVLWPVRKPVINKVDHNVQPTQQAPKEEEGEDRSTHGAAGDGPGKFSLDIGLENSVLEDKGPVVWPIRGDVTANVADKSKSSDQYWKNE